MRPHDGSPRSTVIAPSNAASTACSSTHKLGVVDEERQTCVAWVQWYGERVQTPAKNKQIGSAWLTGWQHSSPSLTALLTASWKQIKGYNYEFEFEHLIQSLKIWPSFNITVIVEWSACHKSCTLHLVIFQTQNGDWGLHCINRHLIILQLYCLDCKLYSRQFLIQLS